MSAVRKPSVESDADEVPENVLILPVAKIELCAAKGDVRYYLNWPYLDLSDEKKPILVATNGHVLAAAEVRVGSKVTAGPLPVAAIRAARAVKTKQPQIGARLIFNGDMVGTPDVMYRRPSGDFKYPDWRKVVPKIKKDRKADFGVNGAYMKLMQDVFGNGHFDRGGLAVFGGQDDSPDTKEKTPILLRSINPDTFETIGVVMPLHI